MSRNMKENQFLSSSLSSVVSINLDSSWASRSWDASYLSQSTSERELRARFQKKQMQEKEQKLLRLYESQQQRAFQRVGRGSAGSSASLSSSTSTLASVGGGGGKVRQLFEERRTNGWDRSYPLEPVAVTGAKQQQQQAAPPQVPARAAPKAKLARGLSLDRSHGAYQQQQQHAQPAAKTVARRSKSHARAPEAAVTNGHLDAGESFSYRHPKPVYDGNQSFRKLTNGNKHHHRDDAEEEYHTSNNHHFRREAPLANKIRGKEDVYDDADAEDEYDADEEINYEALGEDDHVNRNGIRDTALLLDAKRQEELYAKYQVRELGNHDLLASSPPPDLVDDALDDTYVYDKLPNVGGRLRCDEAVNASDRYKTYNTNKHGRGQVLEEGTRASLVMATKVQDAKKVPAVRRETVSPPTRVVKAPAKKTELRGTATGLRTSPAIQSSSINAAPPKQTPSPRLKTTPSSNVVKHTSNSVSKPSANYPKPPQNGPTAPSAMRSTVSKDDLVECSICQRRFATDRIEVHRGICYKTHQKKRKEYDATKHRVQGTEAEQYVRKAYKGGQHIQQKKTEVRKADWRKKHEEFIQTIRAAKEAQAHVAAGGKLSDLPPPPPLDTSDYTQCPHCGRKFNDAAAARHIPKCANMLHNKPKPPAANRTFNSKRR